MSKIDAATGHGQAPKLDMEIVELAQALVDGDKDIALLVTRALITRENELHRIVVTEDGTLPPDATAALNIEKAMVFRLRTLVLNNLRRA